MAKNEESEKVRLDKWLWAARFYKTRAIAKDAIEGGKVHYNGARTKPGKAIELDARLSIRQGFVEKEVVVIAISDKRRGAPEALLLYNETNESIAKREKAAVERKIMMAGQLPPARRPNKKQRRQIHRFENINNVDES
ncbi:ribosome-associated heat shock protein Hsp15 [Alkalimarinus sediminis]|uniref:Heat shock protein 15 n=1 Tax=Alkalimarinus sediminis TaxID=1632866 RepID=A0A9E8KJ30_9ALTE|nr:ribosome-associated heat shock protein Hsp15 [Alkalimarinus sediminis]UZW74571.1 ribosome-associated heat shock protein Hsp15 [Alkalimarinus sediminis]